MARGVKGAAFAACEEIVVERVGTGRVAGVNAGDSTLRERLLPLKISMSALIMLPQWIHGGIET
jgi:hypothetical protein